MEKIMFENEKSLSDWFDEWSNTYISRERLIEYETWLVQQFSESSNIIPLRLVSGRFPKGHHVVENGIVFYSADNEPLAGLIRLVQQNLHDKSESIKSLIVNKKISGSWPIKKIVPFSAKWGPSPLKMKEDGFKIAHLFNAGKNNFGFQGRDLRIRAHRTLSLINCFPFPNSSKYSFELNGILAGDLAEDLKVQSLLLSFMSEYIDNDKVFKEFLVNCGEGDFKVNKNWREIARKMSVRVFPKNYNQKAKAKAKAKCISKPHSQSVIKEVGVSCIDSFVADQNVYSDLWSAVDALKLWRRKFPNALQLDGNPVKKSNPKGCIFFMLNHLDDIPFTIARTTAGGFLNESDFTGVFKLNGDTKTIAIDKLIQMVENENDIDCILEPDMTRAKQSPAGSGVWVGEKPRFIFMGANDAEGFYCYKK